MQNENENELVVADHPMITRIIDAIRKHKVRPEDDAIILVAAGKLWKEIQGHRDFDKGRFLNIRCVSVSQLKSDFKLVTVLD